MSRRAHVVTVPLRDGAREARSDAVPVRYLGPDGRELATVDVRDVDHTGDRVLDG